MAVLNQWAQFLYEPLLQDRVRRIQENDDPQFGRAIAEEVHAGLKRTGGVRPPREFVLMDRSAIGLGSVFVRLGARLNWYRMFHELIADFDEAAVRARQQAALAEAGVPEAVELSGTPQSLFHAAAVARHREAAHEEHEGGEHVALLREAEPGRDPSAPGSPRRAGRTGR